MMLKCRVASLIIPITMLLLACSLPFALNGQKNTDIQPADFNLEFNPDGCKLPCVWNITPGQTEINEALDIIASTVPHEQISASSIFWVWDSHKNQIFIEIYQSGPEHISFVSQVRVLAPDGGGIGTLGDFLLAGYQPVRVFRGEINPPNEVNLLIAFERDGLIVGIHDGQITSASRVTSLYVIDPYLQAHLVDTILTIENYHEITWIGVASAEDYLKVPYIITPEY